MKFVTVALLGLLIAGTAKASQERVLTDDAIGASLFSDEELLMSLANQPGPGESRIVGPRPGYVAAFSLSDEKILMSMKGDFGAIQGMLREGRCRVVIRGTAVVVSDDYEDFVKVRIKGTTDTVWIPKDRVGVSDAGPTPTPSPAADLTPIDTPTPSPVPMTEAERKEMEADWQQFKDADKKERELLQKQEEKRKAQYEAEHKDNPIIIGASPAPQ